MAVKQFLHPVFAREPRCVLGLFVKAQGISSHQSSVGKYKKDEGECCNLNYSGFVLVGGHFGAQQQHGECAREHIQGQIRHAIM